MDAPVGYSGSPYITSRTNSQLYERRRASASPQQSLGQLNLSQFPLEILLIVASSLSQFEIANLIQVNRLFQTVFTPFLYRKITIDNRFSEFNFKEIDTINNTYIKTSYSLKLFLKKILQRHDLCSMIQSFNCLKVPVDIISIQLYESLKQVFPYLVNLKELNWYNSNEIDFKLLSKLPSALNKLYMNTRLLSLANLPKDFNPEKLASLDSCAIAPFQNSNNLLLIRSIINFNNLQTLKLSRLFNKESLLVPPSNTLVTTEDVLDLDLGTIEAVFSHLSTKLSLRKLSLDGILLQPEDFHVLNEHVWLEKLTHLELTNISEINKIDLGNLSALENFRHNSEVPEDIKSTLRTLTEPNFMTQLSTCKFQNLRSVKIDIRQGLVDSTPTLIKSLKNLQSLDITSRWNNTKAFAYPKFECLIHSLIDAIESHSSTLLKLSLELRAENNLINTELLHTLPNQLLEKFAKGYYPNLTGLRMNVSANYLILNNKRLISVAQFPQLTYLNLFGDNLYVKHMGLEVLNPGILDDFFKIQHVVLNLLDHLDTRMRYIMIDEDKVFEVETNEDQQLVDLSPRDGIGEWLMSKVRVGFF